MADIKNVYQVADEMGNSPAMVKNITSKRGQKLKRVGSGRLNQTKILVPI
jgi:predicted transcriptional regulator